MTVEYIIGIVGVAVAAFIQGRHDGWLRGYDQGFEDGKRGRR